MATIKKRDHGFDNIKFFLMFCVVLGHFLELMAKTPRRVFCYQVIYSFHMPVFIFLTGYFARFKREKFIRQLLLPYVVFQLAYCIFEHCVTQEKPFADFMLNMVSPHWIMWYLMTIMCYMLLIPVIDVTGAGKRTAAFLICFASSLISGYDSGAGYLASIGRTLTFLPFFVLGYYMGKGLEPPKFFKNKLFCIALCVCCLGCIVYLKNNPQITAMMMYGAFSYELHGFDVKVKLTIQIIALIWTAFFLFVIKPIVSFKIPVISEIGKNTMPIFLLHGFIVKLWWKHEMFKTVPESLLSLLLIVAAVLLLLGNPFVAGAYNAVFGVRKKAAEKDAANIT